MQHQAMILFENGEAGLRGIVCRSGGRLNETGITLLSCYFQHRLVETLVNDVGDIKELAETPLFCIPAGEKNRHFQTMDDLFQFMKANTEIIDYYLFTNDAWFHATAETLNWAPLVDEINDAENEEYVYAIESFESDERDRPMYEHTFSGRKHRSAENAIQWAAMHGGLVAVRLAGGCFTMSQRDMDAIAETGLDGRRLKFVSSNGSPVIVEEPLNTRQYEAKVVAR